MSVERRENARTCVTPVLSRPLSAREAFRLAWPEAREHMTATCDYILVAVSERTRRAKLIQIAVNEEAGAWPVDVIVGRHSQCQIVLDDDPGVALRQMLIRFYRCDGQLRVRFLDLRTRHGFLDENSNPHRSVISNRHLFVRFAEHHLLAIRNDGRSFWRLDPDAVWNALPRREFVEAAPVELEVRRREPSLRSRIKRFDDDDDTITTVTSVRGSSFLKGQPADHHNRMGMVMIDGRQIWLSQESLAAGVLVGRYERCQIETAQLENNDAISRVHVCLLLDETGLWLVDTASTNGTYVHGESIKTYPLRRFMPFRLASGFDLAWHAGSVA